VRKGTGIPYIAHLLGVAAIVLEAGGDEDEAIAGLLHDVPEDVGGRESLVDIRRLFGERVAKIVEGCTDTFEQPKPEWRPRKERHLAALAFADYSTLLVFTADKLHNATSIMADLSKTGDRLWDQFKGGKDGTLWYYRSASEVVMNHPECTGDLKDLALRLPRILQAVELNS
jgi:(p)ppGpp synthase/HD superfamily hydrolase